MGIGVIVTSNNGGGGWTGDKYLEGDTLLRFLELRKVRNKFN